jgi:hypothetical protein
VEQARLRHRRAGGRHEAGEVHHRLGSYLFDLRARDATGVATGDKFVLTLPKREVGDPDAPDPNADGGTPEITLAGAMRKLGRDPPYQVDIDCDAAAFTV